MAELGYTILQERDNTFSLNLNEVNSRQIKIRLIVSEPIIKRIHGSKNNTEIKSIGYFNFKLAPEAFEPNFYIFAFTNTRDNKVEFVVVPYPELKNRIVLKKCNTNYDQEIELKFWLLPDNLVFDSSGLGAEGEYWFIGGRMAINTYSDFTSFLDGWNQLVQA